ncbi:MAG: HAD family hydrolase [Corynebacteriales bacterium]|nr:HAD family hydrolase [Mycobacteriales bacterium]
MRHLVWDWNGTLFDDANATLAATNDVFAPFNITLTHERYLETFRRPLQDFYTDVLNRPVSNEEFLELDEVFHSAYRRHMLDCALTADATHAINTWAQTKQQQSLLSLWGHNELLPLVEHFGLTSRFVRIDGRRTARVDSKADPLRAHLSALNITADSVVMIGDSLDDAAAAKATGARCVLYTGGAHSPATLAQTGFPVATSLAAAIELALT